MRLTIIAAAIALMATGPARSADDALPGEIVLVEHVRTAYYEAAPRRLAASMRRAVAIECSATEGGAGNDAIAQVHRWLCDGVDDTYLRAVDVLGTKSWTGFVCEGAGAHLKYYLDDIIGHMTQDGSCVPIWCMDRNTHFLDLKNLLDLKDIEE
jgi:hypothetical protein